MFVACGIWCLADVSSVSPSSEQSIFSVLAHAEKQFFSKLIFECRFQYVTCGRANFIICNNKLAESKIFKYTWTGPEDHPNDKKYRMWEVDSLTCDCFCKKCALFIYLAQCKLASARN